MEVELEGIGAWRITAGMLGGQSHARMYVTPPLVKKHPRRRIPSQYARGKAR